MQPARKTIYLCGVKVCHVQPCHFALTAIPFLGFSSCAVLASWREESQIAVKSTAYNTSKTDFRSRRNHLLDSHLSIWCVSKSAASTRPAIVAVQRPPQPMIEQLLTE